MTVEEQVATLREAVAEMRGTLAGVLRWQVDFDTRRISELVSREEFSPVRLIAFGFLGIIATGVCAGVVFAILRLANLAPGGHP